MNVFFLQTTEEAEPPDYENDVKDMEDEIKDDECPELLKFPDDDIEVCSR